MQILDSVVKECTDVVSLAEGGQKKVMAAVHSEFGPVVIKFGNYHLATSLERIAREVELLRELDSQYYPRQFEFIIEPIRREFLVIEERIEAKELSEVQGSFSDDETILGLLRELVRALNEIWQRRVVHRDLKPSNILITAGGQPRIIDLGIARFLEDVSLTATAAGRGPATPIYAAPEQLLNKKSMISIRTDFFLLGILVLELMHGFHPFDPRQVGNDESLLANLQNGLYVPPDSSRNEYLVDFCRHSLQQKPYRRFRTVEAVAEFLNMDDLS